MHWQSGSMDEATDQNRGSVAGPVGKLASELSIQKIQKDTWTGRESCAADKSAAWFLAQSTSDRVVCTKTGAPALPSYCMTVFPSTTRLTTSGSKSSTCEWPDRPSDGE